MLHRNELVNIEEDTILGSGGPGLGGVCAGPRAMIRRFTLQNRANHLAVSILTSGGSVSSCKVDDGRQEIVINSNGKDANGVTMINGVPYTPPLHEWQSHVLGLDSLMLTTSSSQSLLYQLTTTNELLVTGKVKSHLNAMAPFYFNLVSDRTFAR